MTGGLGRRSRAATTLLGVALLLGGVLTACGSNSSADGSGPSSGPSSGSTSPTTSASTEKSTDTATTLPRVTLTVGVFGAPDEVAAYQLMTTQFAPLSTDATVKVESWPDHTAMIHALESGATPPDVFLASRSDLLWLQQHRVIQPVDGLLDDRGVDFGDDYPRDSLSAFAVDNRLQCLPYGVSPEVMFYNKRLLKLSQVPGDPPSPGHTWSLDQFAASARWAVEHHQAASGFYVDPTLAGLLPFFYSGGGQLFDDGDLPTSTAFSSPGGQLALTTALRPLTRARLTLPRTALNTRTPLEWFERGRLALLEGTRAMVPSMRQVLGLNFDVMPMPSVHGTRTVGDMTGMCIARQTRVLGTAADFLVQSSAESLLDIVADAGYFQPANQAAALSDGFQQPGRLPVHSDIFTDSVRALVIPPLIQGNQELTEALDPEVQKLFEKPASRIPAITRAMDRLSVPLLAPDQSGSGASAGPRAASGSSGSSGG